MQKQVIRKAVFPIAGLATRFLPLSKVVSKELIPLVDKPLIHYTVKEAINSGIKEIIFVTRPKQKDVLQYFQPDLKLEKILAEKKKEENDLKEIQTMVKGINFSFAAQKEPLGDGDAVFRAKKFVGDEPFALFFCDDVIDSEVPALSQLIEVFNTCQRPVIALKQLPAEKIYHYGVVNVEKIANCFYKIKNMVEKPKEGQAPSNLAIVGRYILTPDVFDYLKPKKKARGHDISIVSPTLGKMAMDGKGVYGYEFKGDWLECGDKMRWFYSFLHLAVKHPSLGEEVKACLKKLKY
ncbi:MAG: sugar phosphate nucleotidyltransferase [Candidatus Pacebacteria bacterium]|nr:sugar phosphate nucleotidyltransferase [Candidatus Paceibacterota bacterium]MDD4831130.1 sugar phosphate nucleotidyltransferase [Candidatus Paceibacterota bacterium]